MHHRAKFWHCKRAMPIVIAALIFVLIGMLGFRVPQTNADFFENPFVKTLGFISDSYGALQAVEFLGTLIGLFSSNDINQRLEEVKQEIIKAINIGEIEPIKGMVGGVIDSFKDVVSDLNNMHNMSLLSNVISQGHTAHDTIKAVIDDGDVDKVYQLAPAFNTVAVTLALALKLGGYPQSRVDDVIQTTLQYNYLMVGADQIYLPGCVGSGDCPIVRKDASPSKILWKKFFPENLPKHCEVVDPPPDPTTIDLYSEICNVGSLNWGFCGFHFLENPDSDVLVDDGERGAPICYHSVLSGTVEPFNNDDTIGVIKQAMFSAGSDDFAEVTDPSLLKRGITPDQTVSIMNASFFLRPPVNRRLPTPVCQ